MIKRVYHYRIIVNNTWPGMYVQYTMETTVWANSKSEAKEKGYRQVKREFPERNREMWMVDKIEVE